jgi:hypothetical protein
MKDGPLKDAIRQVVTKAVADSNTIGDIWALFEAATLAKGAGAVQRRECKRAFYSGAAAALELFTQIGEPGFEEDAGIRRLEAIARELAQFGEDIQHGRA